MSEHQPGREPQNISPYDHGPRFEAIREYKNVVAVRITELINTHDPAPIVFEEGSSEILLSADEIAKLWGTFPETARERAWPKVPIIRTGPPKWFGRNSTAEGPVVTDNADEAISTTAHGLAHTDPDGSITLHEIPENGFNYEVKRLVQAGVLIHELAHTIANPDLWEKGGTRQFILSGGRQVAAVDWIIEYAQIAERHLPISRYSSAYRNPDNTFPRQGEDYLGVPILEELVDSMTSYLLGYVVRADGITFKPFENREVLKLKVEEYLMAQLSRD